MENSLAKLSEVNRVVRNSLIRHEDKEFPVQVYFNQGIQFPRFKVTIEKEESDVYVDPSGQKWKKVK